MSIIQQITRSSQQITRFYIYNTMIHKPKNATKTYKTVKTIKTTTTAREKK